MTNTHLLNVVIGEKGLKRQYIAEKLGLSPFGLAKKISGANEFKGREIAKLSELLDLNIEQRDAIFFAE
jgi:hypothetical protein